MMAEGPRKDGLSLLEEHSRTAMRAMPHLIVRRHEGGVTVKGDRTATLGTPIPSPQGDQGIWVRWVWDRNRLELRQDRHGFHPFYYFTSPDGWGIGPSIHRLIEEGAPPELDDAAIAVYLRVGLFLGNDTPFRAIRALPPGGWLVAEGAELSVGADRSPAIVRPVNGQSFEATVEQYGEMFQSAVERLVPFLGDRNILPLSGGHDSRHILLALCRAGHPPRACASVDLGPPQSWEDTVIARQVAERVGVPFEYVGPPRSLLQVEIEKNVRTSLTAEVHSWITPLRHVLEREGATARVDGIAGDMLSEFSGRNQAKSELMEAGRYDELVELALGSEGYLPRMLSEEYRRRWSREVAAARFLEEVKLHAGATNPWVSFRFQSRTRREIGSVWTLLSGPWNALAPYLDYQLVDFLAGLPGQRYRGTKLHAVTIAKFFPDFADIPFATKQWGIVSDRAHWAREAARLLPLLANGRRNGALDRDFLLRRLPLALGGPVHQRALSLLYNRAVYLLQLERLAGLA